MTASLSSSLSTWRHLSKMEGILSMRYRLRSWQAVGPYLRARALLKQPGRSDFAEHELPPRIPPWAVSGLGYGSLGVQSGGKRVFRASG